MKSTVALERNLDVEQQIMFPEGKSKAQKEREELESLNASLKPFKYAKSTVQDFNKEMKNLLKGISGETMTDLLYKDSATQLNTKVPTHSVP